MNEYDESFGHRKKRRPRQHGRVGRRELKKEEKKRENG